MTYLIVHSTKLTGSIGWTCDSTSSAMNNVGGMNSQSITDTELAVEYMLDNTAMEIVVTHIPQKLDKNYTNTYYTNKKNYY